MEWRYRPYRLLLNERTNVCIQLDGIDPFITTVHQRSLRVCLCPPRPLRPGAYTETHIKRAGQ
eukprot:6178652-Pleurochrysis_carterae.AAC.8